jgi:hypothetical protein
MNSWFTWSACFVLYSFSLCASWLFGGANNKGSVIIPNHRALEVFRMPVSTDAISDSERTFIIHQLATTGKWEGKRNGAQISIVRLTPLMFHFAVTVSSSGWTSSKNGSRVTVEAALDAANEAIDKLKALPKPMVGRVPDPMHTGMGKLIRRGENDEVPPPMFS